MAESPEATLFGVVVACATFLWGIYEFSQARQDTAATRRRERALQAANEVKAFYDDELVDKALKMIDYSRNIAQYRAAEAAEPADLDAYFVQSLAVGKDDVYTDSQHEIRDAFDHLLFYLGRMEKLIETEVISEYDFGQLFSYWFELAGEKPRREDKLTHFEDLRREALWRYIRYYKFNGAIRLFRRYGRAAPIDADAPTAFVPRPGSPRP